MGFLEHFETGLSIAELLFSCQGANRAGEGYVHYFTTKHGVNRIVVIYKGIGKDVLVSVRGDRRGRGEIRLNVVIRYCLGFLETNMY